MTVHTETSVCCASQEGTVVWTNPYNTLQLISSRCILCGMCLMVCPHAVFAEGDNTVEMLHPADCIECGACQVNCPTGAIQVNSGVGCAAAMINAALKGSSEVSCGCDSDSCCG
jgi:NAD-dependent dihydropyrimidine dehydrogenase PreA subunit